MQKIKAASELYIETEKKKREKAYLGKASLGSGALGICRVGGQRAIRVGPEPLELESGPGGRGEPGGAGRWKREGRVWVRGGGWVPGWRKQEF